jgi:predicted extracellular nuclease
MVLLQGWIFNTILKNKKMKKVFWVFFTVILFNTANLFSQETDTLCIGFYNLENLFDTADDPQKEDEEFTPGGENAWTQERLNQKFYNLARVIRTMNGFKGPDVLGVCEVEHQHLLDTLTEVYLHDKFYKVAYVESPDNRGIDNGLIYNADKFRLISINADTINLSDGWPTRQVVKVTLEHRKGYSRPDNKITFFINHWPSRRGGEAESEKNRIAAAETVKKGVDDILAKNPDAKIIIMGDFNDEPGNTSIKSVLGAALFDCAIQDSVKQEDYSLFNAAGRIYRDGGGSYRYQSDWNMLDQIIISRSFLTDDKFSYLCNSFIVFKPDFTVTKTGDFAGTSIPTFGGRRYLGGYSDHFPVNAKFIIKE